MKIFPVFIPHAGCPHQCLFCAQDRTNSQVEVPSPEEVLRGLDDVLPGAGQGEIAFYGGTFTLLPVAEQRAYLEVAGEFVAAGRVDSIRISTRPDAVDDNCLQRLHEFGVRTIELGCQSFSDNVLRLSGRGHDKEDNVAAVQLCKGMGFAVGVQLMPGLQGDSMETAVASCREALKHKPDFLRIYPTVVVDGTPLAGLWQQGDYSPWSLEQAIEACAEMLLLCQHAGVPVIRTGLQQDPQLEANLLAGPYHPAFGQLVRSRLWRRLMSLVNDNGAGFNVNPGDYSDAVGHRGENRAWFTNRNTDFSLSADSSVERGMLRVAGQDFSMYRELAARIGI